MKKISISKGVFLNDDAVRGFIEYLVKLINGKENCFYHSYRNRKTKGEWSCNSLQDAFKQYDWKGKSYLETKGLLDGFKGELRKAFNSNNNKAFKVVCRNILKWGGVLPQNTTWLDNHDTILVDSFSESKEMLTDQEELKLDKADWNEKGRRNTSKFRMNAGYTKIYSLLCDDFIIYDSRVAAALGKLVVNFLNENKNENFTELKKKLAFKVMPAKEGENCNSPKIRKPISQHIKFTGINNSGFSHAEWNVKANWILAAAVEKAVENSKMSWGGDNKQDKLRALEAALFMIGYDLPIPSDKKEKNTPVKGKLPKIIKEKVTSKKEQAIEIYKNNKGKKRPQIIELLINEANLTKAGASTYYNNCKNRWVS